MASEAGADRVGIKISPEMNYNSITDAAPEETYTYLVGQLREWNLAYLHVALFSSALWTTTGSCARCSAVPT